MKTWPRPDGWWIAALAIESALPAATVWLTRRITASWDSSGGIIWAALLAGAIGLGEVVRALRGWLAARQAASIRDSVTDAVHDKSMRVDLSFHDDAAFHERLHAARVQAPDQSAALVEGLGAIAQSLVGITLLGVMLVSVSPWLPPVLAAAMAPLLAVRLAGAKRLNRWRRETQDAERRSWYCDYLLTCAEPAAELRLFGWGDRVRSRFQELRAGMRAGESAAHRRNAIEQVAALGFAALVCGLALPWIRSSAMRLPDALAAAQACYYGFAMMQPLIASVAMVYSAVLLLRSFDEFLALPETNPAAGSPRPLRYGIQFRGVRFQYANAAEPVFKGLDLFVAAGEITAITGANGSGKSTLAKLLCGLYQPCAGSIEFDGEPGPAEGMVSAMFQEPVRYQDTLAANIAPADRAPERVGILAAARDAGLGRKIASWPEPESQVLGNQFPSGAELSGGEWQKTAFARALYRNSPVLVLDEPTSMMDPRAESDFLNLLRVRSRGRTVVIITHRRAVAGAADRVVEMSDGMVRDFSQVN